MLHATLATVASLATLATVPAVAVAISIPDQTLTTQAIVLPDTTTVYGHAAATVDGIDAQSGPVTVSGAIGEFSDPKNSWLMIGLMPRASWSTDGSAWGAGVHVVNWWGWANDYGLSLGANGTSGPYAYPLSESTDAAPWEFEITLTPSGPDGGVASFALISPTATYVGGTSMPYSGDFSDAILVAQFTGSGPGETVAIRGVQAVAIPEPASLVLAGLGGLAMLGRRR